MNLSEMAGPRLAGNDGLISNGNTDSTGTTLKGKIEYPLSVIKDLFGLPLENQDSVMWELDITFTWDPENPNDPDDYNVEWITEPLTIYDHYNQDMTDPTKPNVWNVGGKSNFVVGLLKDYIERNLHMTSSPKIRKNHR